MSTVFPGGVLIGFPLIFCGRREAVEQAETGIHRDTSDIDQLLIFRRVVPTEGRLMVAETARVLLK